MSPVRLVPTTYCEVMPKYKKLAAQIEKMIETGILTIGSRAPALRVVVKRYEVSMSTAILAYRFLENRGVLVSKEKSGFYVATRSTSALRIPQKSNPRIESFPIRLSHSFVELLELSKNPEYVPLGCAIPSVDVLKTSKLNRHLVTAARKNGADLNLYTEPSGDLRLRMELCRHIASWGQNVAPENLIVTNGCTEALYLALKVTTKPGDTVVIESPAYFGVLQILESLSLRVFELPTDFHDGIDTEVLETILCLHQPAVLVLSSSYSNPLGSTMNQNEKLKVLALVEKFKITLIEDDVYGDLTFEVNRPKPYSALTSKADVLYCGSLSKTVAPGSRVGWITSRYHIQSLLEIKLATTLAGPALIQAAVASYLSSGDYNRHLIRIRRIFQVSLESMRLAVEKYFPKNTFASLPKGGFILWVVLPKKIDTRKLLDQALEENICFVPGDMFSASGGYSNALRLSAGYIWDNIAEAAIKRLGTLAKEY